MNKQKQNSKVSCLKLEAIRKLRDTDRISLSRQTQLHSTHMYEGHPFFCNVLGGLWNISFKDRTLFYNIN